MNSLIEIELVGDNKLNTSSDGKILKPQPVSCKQKTYTNDTIKIFQKDAQRNLYGEVFYVCDKVSKIEVLKAQRFGDQLGKNS